MVKLIRGIRKQTTQSYIDIDIYAKDLGLGPTQKIRES